MSLHSYGVAPPADATGKRRGGAHSALHEPAGIVRTDVASHVAHAAIVEWAVHATTSTCTHWGCDTPVDGLLHQDLALRI